MDWLQVYWDFYKKEFKQNLEFKEGEILKAKIYIKKEKTKPPSRYSQASLVKKMESLGLGTKSTRALIVSTIIDRNYVTGKRSLKITPLGEKIIELFDKYLPEIIDVNLTRKLESELERIEKGETWRKEKVIEETKEIIRNVSEEFKKKEDIIGKELYEIYKELQKQKKNARK